MVEATALAQLGGEVGRTKEDTILSWLPKQFALMMAIHRVDQATSKLDRTIPARRHKQEREGEDIGIAGWRSPGDNLNKIIAIMGPG